MIKRKEYLMARVRGDNTEEASLFQSTNCFLHCLQSESCTVIMCHALYDMRVAEKQMEYIVVISYEDGDFWKDKSPGEVL